MKSRKPPSWGAFCALLAVAILASIAFRIAYALFGGAPRDADGSWWSGLFSLRDWWNFVSTAPGVYFYGVILTALGLLLFWLRPSRAT